MIAVTNQQTISYVGQNQTSQPKCHIEGDDIIYHGQINISGKMESFDYSQYELQLTNSDVTTICTLDLHKCYGYSLSNCYCSNTESKDVFDVTINITGLPSYSESVLRGKLIFFDRNIYSDGIILPKIYDRAKPMTKLFINDNIVNLETCEESINRTDVNFVFFLDHDHAHTDNLPCRLEIADGLNNTLKDTELVTLSYTAKVYRSHTFILSYEFCGSHKNKGSFVCNIKAVLPDVSLVINNKEVNITNCEETVNSSEVNFVFSVKDRERPVNRLALMGDTTGETIETNSVILTHSASFHGNRMFIFTYELVGLDEKSFYCSIQAGKDKAVELPMDFCGLDGNNTIYIILMILSIIVNVAFVTVCSLLRLRKLCARNQKPDLEVEMEQLSIEEVDALLNEESSSPRLSQQYACSDECKKKDIDSEHEGNLREGSNTIVQAEVQSDSTIEPIEILKTEFNVDYKNQHDTHV
ncbi:hypothetical protein Btru_071815 [Bulinus truncatus]|nr:hypothetical protein Btru_071815 [Bulinus truncatus]